MGQEGDSAGYRRRLKSNLSSLFGARCKAGSFFCTEFPGHTNCVSVFAPAGRLLFLRRLTGAHELPQACSPLTGGGFSLNLSGECADAARRAQEGRHLRFPPSCESPLSLLARRKSESGDRCEIRERQSGYRSVSFATCLQFTDTVLLHIRATLRWVRHDSAAQFFSTL